ncbi:MAG TPA: radical SAM protein [Firmicutes bacterium]|nr:radical SAM protein [Bacillota bacterium]
MMVRKVLCKSALVKSGIADHALNPYTGCAHGCVYCYASFMGRFAPHGRPWGRWVDVKVNVADTLRRDLQHLRRRAKGSPPEVFISSVTDAYQPLERTFRVTRACLEVIATAVNEPAQQALPLLTRPDASLLEPDASRPNSWLRVSILTKSDLVLRDLDVLQDIPGVEVGMTITTADDAVSKRYEPGAPPATRRLAALRRLADAGISTWAFISPVLPYHADSRPAVRSILTAVRDAGVVRVMVDRFNPYPASVSRFLKVASAEAAETLREYIASPREYLDRLRATVAEAAAGLGLAAKLFSETASS